MERPQSPLASSYVPMLGVKRGLYVPRTRSTAIVVHTTGIGPLARLQSLRFALWRHKHPEIQTALEAALWIYSNAHNAGGHYLVSGDTGEVVQTAPEELAVWQVGKRNVARYRRAWRSPRYEWWFKRWPGLKSPLELACGRLWEDGSCNAGSIGIEVVPRASGASDRWSPQAESKLATLVEDIASRHGIRPSESTVLSHSDAHPLSRTSSRGAPWDPGPEQWQGWADLLRRTGRV